MTYLERMVTALAMASPWCMAARYADLAHCIEASMGGVGALKKHRIDARPLPCVVVAGNPRAGEQGYVHALGHTAESAYEWFCSHTEPGDEPPPAFEEWKTGVSFPASSLHLIIEAKHCGKRALIDLTAGKIHEASAGQIDVPPVVVYYGEGWPDLDLDNDSYLSYAASPYREITRAPWRDHDFSGVIGDMVDVMGVALRCNLDRDRFRREIVRIAQLQGVQLK
ncbi:hypothetical protein [Polyangium sp. 6x1]|uniref:hypothetical protein n=1 Tax=Polyangium sp. 6x1 TaxID=3042689 RepID=UPI002482BEB6|nr:hypothetical protein [Polyangium sp. 6x1]MDI1450013.1 hypothetical protein [Polyangium sp. 6x1]